LYQGSPYSEPVDDIQYHRHSRYNYENTLAYYRNYYQPQNVVLSIVTNQSFNHIIQVLSKTFFVRKTTDSVKGHQIPHPINIGPMPTEQNITYNLLEKKDMESLHLCITFRTCKHANKDRFILNLLSQMIGGSMGSRMSILLREQNGLTYESQCSTDYLQIGGEFTIYAVTDPTKFMANGKKKGVFPLLIDLVKQLLKSGVTQEELDTAKGNFKGKLLIQQEKITNTAEYNGLQCAIYPDEPFVPYSDIYASCYDKITLKEVNETIAKYLKYSNMYISTIGKKGSHYPSLEQMKIVCQDINIPIYK
jgi:hypothetical protein